MNDYLCHYGRTGMRWGDRNGPPYPLQRAQLSTRERRASSENGYRNQKEKEQARREREQNRKRNSKTVRYVEVNENQNGQANNKDRDAIVGQLSKKTNETARQTMNLTKKIVNMKQPEVDVSGISEAEMRAYITRKNLERQYSSLKREEMTSGRQKAYEIMDITGDVLTTVGGVLTIATLAKALAAKKA